MKFRPATAVARDLLKLATPKARRPRKVRDPVRHARPAPVVEDDETPDAPTTTQITLPPVTMASLTDEDVGLPHDPVAQEKAERFLLAAYAYTLREKEKARAEARARMMPGTLTIHEEVPDNAIVLLDPTDRLTSDDAVVLQELRRLAGMPSPSWLKPDVAAVPMAS